MNLKCSHHSLFMKKTWHKIGRAAITQFSFFVTFFVQKFHFFCLWGHIEHFQMTLFSVFQLKTIRSHVSVFRSLHFEQRFQKSPFSIVEPGVLGARVPPRFSNKQRSAIFIFRKCPLFLKNKMPSKCSIPPSLRCFLRPSRHRLKNGGIPLRFYTKSEQWKRGLSYSSSNQHYPFYPNNPYFGTKNFHTVNLTYVLITHKKREKRNKMQEVSV